MVAKKISCLLFRTNKEPLEKPAKKNAKKSKNVIFLDELHLNLWNFDKKFTYLDLGLLIDVGPLEGLDKKELFISIPGKYESEDFFDLGKDLSSDSDMITAIFNEPTISIIKNQSFTAIIRNNKNIIIIPFSLGKTFEYSYRKDILCTEIIIDLIKLMQVIKDNNLVDSHKIYMRFRIKTEDNTYFIKSFTPEDEGVLSSTIRTKILDVRINESRWLPSFLIDNHLLEFVKFKKIHFFLTINREYELGDHSKNYNTSRSLTEEDIWQKYLRLSKDDNIVQNSLGYHWKTNKDDQFVEDFNLLGRFSRIETSKLKIIIFLLFLLLIGLVSSSLITLLTDCVFNNFRKCVFHEIGHAKNTKIIINLLVFIISGSLIVLIAFCKKYLLYIFKKALDLFKYKYN